MPPPNQLDSGSTALSISVETQNINCLVDVPNGTPSSRPPSGYHHLSGKYCSRIPYRSEGETSKKGVNGKSSLLLTHSGFREKQGSEVKWCRLLAT